MFFERSRSRANGTGALRLAAWMGAVALSLGGLPMAASAIDLSLCKDDGVTEVPGFAAGRDGNGCLMVDPGNGKAAVPFQYKNFHKTGVASCAPKLASTTKVDWKYEKYGACRTKDNGHACTQLVWDVVVDNYLDPGCKNEDVIFMGPPWEYFFMKNVVIANGWACKGGDWKGPNGLSCSSSEDSEAHSDGMQVRGQPANDGWFVMQDSVFVNGYNLHLLQQTESDTVGPTGSDLFQGVEFGRRQSIGAATSWIDDCRARQKPEARDSDICTVGRANIGTALREAWFVDVWGVTTISLDAVREKIVVVNTGCGKTGCGGAIGYSNGWPHPITRSGSGPGTCPDGQIGSSPPTFCYRSLEKALAAGHAAPPFIRLSAAGWERPPSGTGTTRPSPPILEP